MNQIATLAPALKCRAFFFVLSVLSSRKCIIKLDWLDQHRVTLSAHRIALSEVAVDSTTRDWKQISENVPCATH